MTEGVYADAFVITAEAFVHASQRGPAVLKMMTRVSGVRFITGRAPAAALHGPIVQITLTPQLGIGGRPSSELIAAVLARR
jgi:hypothetical protein